MAAEVKSGWASLDLAKSKGVAHSSAKEHYRQEEHAKYEERYKNNVAGAQVEKQRHT